jgi:hypothetical protein
MQAVVIYCAVNLEHLNKQLYASANPLDIAFRSCADGVHEWLKEKSLRDLDTHDFASDPLLPSTLALFIADDGDKKDKAALQNSYRDMRKRMRPPTHEAGKLFYLHDDMYFGDSKFSVGIQLADLCGYFIAKHLEGEVAAEGFFNMIASRIVNSRTEP